MADGHNNVGQVNLYPNVVELDKFQIATRMTNLQALIKEITATEAQDVLIVEGEKIEVKVKGVLTVAEHLEAWTRDDFNHFVGSVSQEMPKNYNGPRGQNYLNNTVCIDLLNEGLELEEINNFEDIKNNSKGKITINFSKNKKNLL